MVKIGKYNVYKYAMTNKSIMFTFFYLNNSYQFDSVTAINILYLIILRKRFTYVNKNIYMHVCVCKKTKLA